MAVISEVKCGRCDRRYSGFRSRCPYCGARRNKRGKHADEGDNAKAKLVIGVLLLVLLIAATMVLIFTSLSDNNGEVANPSDSAAITTDPEPSDPEAGVSGVENSSEPTTSPSESPSPSVNTEIAEVIIVWDGDGEPRSDVTLAKAGDSLQMDVKTVPDVDLTGKVVKWASSDDKVFVVGVTNGKISATGKGSATLTVTIDDIVAECIVRVRA